MSCGYFTFQENPPECVELPHNRQVWKGNFRINTRGNYYKIGDSYYDKVNDIAYKYGRERSTLFRWVHEGHPQGIPIKVVSCREFLSNTEHKNW